MSAAGRGLPERRDPIFILSPLPRCGTNFLWDLLRLHPHCAPGRTPIWEDYLLKNAQPLVDFAVTAQQSWDPVWGSTDHLRRHLLRHLGDGIIDFMTIHKDRRMVTKSPSVDNLGYFFELWPQAYVLLLVRDGRDVVQSGMVTFGWDLEGGARGWAKGVRDVQRFLDRDDVPAERARIVRYEDLVKDRAEIENVLSFLDLPVDLFDFNEAENLPIRGSSSHRGDGDNVIHWDPVEQTEDFDPVRRWTGWDEASLEIFSDIAGAELSLLGYPSHRTARSTR